MRCPPISPNPIAPNIGLRLGLGIGLGNGIRRNGPEPWRLRWGLRWDWGVGTGERAMCGSVGEAKEF